MRRGIRFCVILVCSLFAVSVHATEPEFTVTTTADTTEFSFTIEAARDFTIDWGDGNMETINKTAVRTTTCSHTYSTAGEYDIGISGQATEYGDWMEQEISISFANNKNIAGISGSLGAIFGTLDSGTHRQPVFEGTFMGCSNMTGQIPAELFNGISGQPEHHMFFGTFSGCSGLTGTIPANLFSGISGSAGAAMFMGTFDGCSGLTGYVDANLFSNITDNDMPLVYQNTFSGATGMDTVCPANTYTVDKPDSSWTVAVCSPCPTGTTSPADSPSIDSCVCDSGFVYNSAGWCGALCGGGFTTLNTSTGIAAPVFADKNTNPAIHIRQNDTVCYVDLVAGSADGAINVMYNGTAYHTAP